VRLLIESGTDDRSIAQAHFGTWVRNRQSLAAYRLLIREERNWPVSVTVLWGPSGSGKSRRAREMHPDSFWLTRHNNGNQYWDGYEGQANVVIDEFYGWLSRGFVQTLCDRYPMQLRTTSGSVACMIRHVTFTSNVHPRAWWPSIGLGAMERRLDVIEYVDYSAENPCVTCQVHPHTNQCTFERPPDAPEGASGLAANADAAYAPSYPPSAHRSEGARHGAAGL